MEEQIIEIVRGLTFAFERFLARPEQRLEIRTQVLAILAEMETWDQPDDNIMPD